MIITNIIFIIVLVALNAFFVSVEFAVVASRRTRLELLPESEGWAGRLVKSWLENPATRDRMIAATQLGITAISLALGAVGENTFQDLLDPLFQNTTLPPYLQFLETILPALPLILSLLIVTSFTVVLGEQVPKVAVLQNPEKFAIFSAPFMNLFNAIFKGFVSVMDWTTHRVLQLMGIRGDGSHTMVYTLEEIRQLVASPAIEDTEAQPEREMLTAVFDFGDLIVRQVMIPRTEIIAVDANAPLQDVIDLAIEHTVTKLPVYEENLDQIIGIVYIKDLLHTLKDTSHHNEKTRSLVREALFVPETISVNSLLYQFRARRQHIAIILDEFGGTAGLVTLEDLLEEIVGEVSDVFDVTTPPFQTLPDGSAMVDGMILIEEVNAHFGLHLYDENYDTVAGYVLGKLGCIPKVGDAIENKEDGVRLKVEAMDGLRIAKLSIARM